MKPKIACILAPLAAASLAGPFVPQASAAADIPVAVLGIEATDGAPDTLVAALTDALRQRVSSTKGFRLVPGRDLVEVKLVFSCPDEAPSCMAQAGKSLGAGKLIFGSAKKSAGETFVVTLKLLDTNRGVVEQFVAEQITKAQATGAAIRGPVQKWFGALTGQGGAGTIRVRGDVIGASVALDGVPSGMIGTEDLVLSGVTAGKHEVRVTKPGYEPVRRDLTVASGETAQVDAKMSKSGGAAAVMPPPVVATVVTPPPPSDQPSSGSGNTALKVSSWAVAGAGLVAVVLGVKFGLDVQAINRDLDPYRRFPCTKSTSGLCNIKNDPDSQLSDQQRTYVNAKTADGDRMALLQYVSYGVGGALLITGGYLFYRGYLRPARGEQARAPGTRLSVVPVLSPTDAGFAAQLRF